MKKNKYTTGKIQFNYRNQATKYYHLTESSGYPSAEYHFSYNVKDRTGLVIPETRADSANPASGMEQNFPAT